MLICVDPGHGGKFPGAISKNRKYLEKDNTLTIARTIHNMECNLPGVQFCYTRLDDKHFALDVINDLQARCDFANQHNADFFISIHQNADIYYHGYGAETYSLAEVGEGRKLAKYIQNKLVINTDLYNRGVKTARYYVLRETKMPAVLVEAGFVGGEPNEAEYISRQETIQRIAEGILMGVADYLGIEYGKRKPFPDVPADHWAADAVAWCKENGYMTGFSDGTFRGDEPLTRYQMAAILQKLKS